MTAHRLIQAAALSSVAALLAVAGCQSNETSLNALLADEPTDIGVFADTTQPIRDYPRSVAMIPNGDTAAGTTGARWRSRDDLNPALVPLVEPAVFVGNVVTLPYTLVEERGTVVSSGLQFPPTHTAMPPLPPERNAAGDSMDDSINEPAISDAAMTDPAAVADAPTTMPASPVLTRTTTRPDAPAFTISGQVLRPGTYNAGDDLRLSQVIEAAAPSANDPAKVRVQIDRPGEVSAITTLDQLRSGAVDDVAVKAGDSITISVLP